MKRASGFTLIELMLVIAIIAIISVIVFALFTKNVGPFCDKKRVTVEEIGGCSSGGLCGVRYSDGSNGRIEFPVKGQKVWICQ